MDSQYKALLSLPAVRFAPFLAAGMMFAYYFGDIALWLLTAAAVTAAALAVKKNKFTLCVFGLAAGLLLMTLHIKFYCEPVLSYAGKTVRAEFTVGEILEYSENGVEFSGKMNLGGLSANVRLSGERRVEEGYFAEATIELDLPDEEYLTRNLAKGILLSGNITEYHLVKPQDNVFTFIRNIRRELFASLCRYVCGESREISSAILFGNDENLPQTLSEQIKISGTAHYTAASGTHFAILAAVILQFIPTRKRKTKALFSIMTAAGAVVFFGATASVMRASAMFIISAAAPLFRRKSETLNTLCLAVSVILVISPGAVLDAGFAMSVLGVFGVGVIGPKISEKLNEFLPEKAKFLSAAVSAITSSFCALVCTAPVSIAVFKGVSLCAVITSLLIAPFMSVGMMFMIFLGIFDSGILAVPVDFSMKAILAIVKFFGNLRGMFISLDFDGAWVLAALCAILLTAAAFGSMKTFRRCAEGTAVLSLASMLISLYTANSRSEIRFVGNYYTNAAVFIQGREAVVFVSGNGTGLADDISRCMREHGAVKISVLAAFETDLSGALSIKELTDMVETEDIFTSETALQVLDIDSARSSEKITEFSVNGKTVSSAPVGDSGANSDIVLYHGTSRKNVCSAGLGIFFVNPGRKLPENAVNIRINRDFCVELDSQELNVTVIGEN